MLDRLTGESIEDYAKRLSADLCEALNLLEDVVNGGVCEVGALWPTPARALISRYEGQF